MPRLRAVVQDHNPCTAVGAQPKEHTMISELIISILFPLACLLCWRLGYLSGLSKGRRYLDRLSRAYADFERNREQP